MAGLGEDAQLGSVQGECPPRHVELKHTGPPGATSSRWAFCCTVPSRVAPRILSPPAMLSKPSQGFLQRMAFLHATSLRPRGQDLPGHS